MIGQSYDYTTSSLIDSPHFKENYKLIAIDLGEKTSTRCWSKNNAIN